MVQLTFIQSARCNIANVYDLHHFEIDVEHLEFIDSLLADLKYHFPVEECVKRGEHCANLTQRQ
jgi:hypothetical protein